MHVRSTGLTVLSLVICSGCSTSWTKITGDFDQKFPPEPKSGEYQIVYRVIEPVHQCGDRAHPCDQEQSEYQGATLVFIHGLGDSKFAWLDVATVLSVQHGYRCILIDLLGHGASDKPRVRGLYTMQKQGERVSQFLRSPEFARLGHKIVLIGQSYGVVTALEISRTFAAEHVTVPRLESLVLTGPPAFYFDSLDPAERYLQKSKEAGNKYQTRTQGRVLIEKGLNAPDLILALLPGNSFIDTVLAMSFWDKNRIPDDYRRELEWQYSHVNSRWALLAATTDMFDDLYSRRDELGRYSAITCPMLLMWGEFDKYPPRSIMETLKKNASGPVEAHIIEDCGHSVPSEQPTIYMRHLISFIDRK